MNFFQNTLSATPPTISKVDTCSNLKKEYSLKYTLALMVFFTSIFALANDVYVTAKTYLGSPCYYTNTLSDIQVYYRGQDLENAKVELDYGFQMQNLYDGMIYNWTYKNLISFRKENDQYVAQIVGQTLHTLSLIHI